jgi:hypothetical protein
MPIGNSEGRLDLIEHQRETITRMPSVLNLGNMDASSDFWTGGIYKEAEAPESSNTVIVRQWGFNQGHSQTNMPESEKNDTTWEEPSCSVDGKQLNGHLQDGGHQVVGTHRFIKPTVTSKGKQINGSASGPEALAIVKDFFRD